MLIDLHVKNFAIIDNININFKSGMTVLTGETGAGKTLIIDAIGLLFGKRASVDLIRHGEEKCIIEGVFSEINEDIKSIFLELDIPFSDEDYLIIKREIFANGKSTCRVNGNLITLGQLVEITDQIGDIHSQFDTQGLVNPKNYLQFINNSEIDKLVLDYQSELKNYKKLLNKYNALISRQNQDQTRIEFLKYQINELDKASISLEEEEELLEQFKVLNNYENIYQNINTFLNLYQDNNVLESIYSSISNLQKLNEFEKKYEPLVKNLEEAYYLIEDIYQEVSHQDFSSFDISQLEYINERLGFYADLRRKYKMSTQEVIDYHLKIKEEVSEIENYDFNINELQKNLKKSYHIVLDLGQNITSKRKTSAEIIQKEIKKHLADLQLKNTDFQITFEKAKENNFLDDSIFKNDGLDTIDFLVSFNKGEPLKSLSKVASGGEMSRFMLALKSIVAEKLSLQLMIFDEIDSGVSGLVAYSISEKIKQISKKSQVLCITHLPQVAANGDYHLKIIKKIENERTFSEALDLSIAQRINEIAKMISNGNVTEASKKMAEELIYKFAN